MTWKSHIAIASAVTLPFNPYMLPFSVLGSTAPDWSEFILKFFGIRVQHRGATHYLYIPILIIIIGIVTTYPVMWFGIGYLTHWIADSMTISGVPLSQYDKHRIHFFGGKIRTGESLEYMIAFGLLALSITITQPSLQMFKENNDELKIREFNAFYIDYKNLYENHIIDEKTYRQHRWKFF